MEYLCFNIQWRYILNVTNGSDAYSYANPKIFGPCAILAASVCLSGPSRNSLITHVRIESADKNDTHALLPTIGKNVEKDMVQLSTIKFLSVKMAA